MKIFTFNEASSPRSSLAFTVFQNRFSHTLFSICRLEELKIDDNLLTTLPNTLKLLRNLKSISVSNNKIKKLPDFMIAMRFNNGVVSKVVYFLTFLFPNYQVFSGLYSTKPIGHSKKELE